MSRQARGAVNRGGERMDLQTLLIVSAALGAGGLVKGALGLGMPLVALPALTTAFGLRQAIGVIVVTVLISNIAQIWRYRAWLRDPALGFMPGFLLGGLGGIALGTVALVSLPEQALQAGLGAMLLGYVALRLLRPDFAISARVARWVSLPVGVAGGAVQGATGIVAPIGVTFINAMRLERAGAVAAASTMFFVYGAAQLAALAVAGVYRLEWLWMGLFAVVPVLMAMPLGEALGRRMNAKAFDRVILGLLTVLGAKLLLGL